MQSDLSAKRSELEPYYQFIHRVPWKPCLLGDVGSASSEYILMGCIHLVEDEYEPLLQQSNIESLFLSMIWGLIR